MGGRAGVSVQIMEGDCRHILPTLPAQSVQCAVTSPPYYGLRNYNVDGQIGLESTVEAYVAEMVGVFREVRRVLRDDGIVWLNLGDSYAANRPYQTVDNKHRDVGNNGAMRVPDGLKPKDLIGVPWRVAFALQADGWWLRSDCIWSKPNPMPESVRDRPTKAHEYVFLLTKSERYFYDADAVRTPYNEDSIGRYATPMQGTAPGARKPGGDIERKRRDERVRDPNPLGANLRTVWTITTRPFKDWTPAVRQRPVAWDAISDDTKRIPSEGCPAHASWDRRHSTPASGVRVGDELTRIVDSGGRLVLLPIFDCASTHLSRDVGTALDSSGWLPQFYAQTAIARSTQSHRRDAPSSQRDTPSEQTPSGIACSAPSHDALALGDCGSHGWSETLGDTSHTGTCTCSYVEEYTESISHFATFPPDLAEICIKSGSRPGDTVLDPFGGAGTTGLVADRLGRDAVLIELNPQYAQMARERITSDAPLFAAVS